MGEELDNVVELNIMYEELEYINEVSMKTVNNLIQFYSLEIISKEYYKKNIKFITNKLPILIKGINSILDNYEDFMEELMELSLTDEGDEIDIYFEETEEADLFNNSSEQLINDFIEYKMNLLTLLDEMALEKMFILDPALLEAVERDFDYIHRVLENVEIF